MLSYMVMYYMIESYIHIYVWFYPYFFSIIHHYIPRTIKPSMSAPCFGKAVHTFHGASASGGRLVHHSTLHVGQRWGWPISGILSG